MSTWRIRSGDPKAIGLFGRVFLSLFALVFIGMGGLFTAWLVRDGLRDLETRRWVKTECVILESSVQESRGGAGTDRGYRFQVRYQYTFDGRESTGSRHLRQNKAYSDYSQALRLREKYPADTKAVCLVNPRDPAEAVLENGSMWFIALALFPLLFVAVGAGVLWFAWRGRGDARAAEAKALTEQANPAGQRRFVGVFFTCWLLFSSAALFFFTIRPLTGIFRARAWTETPCKIVSSEVRTHSGDDGSTYSVNILYTYAVNGKEYTANRYHFMGGSSSGRAGKAAVVARFPAGAQAVCYVNPGDPTDAVLERGFTADLWWGALPALFVLIGVGGLAYFFGMKTGPAVPGPGSGVRMRERARGGVNRPEPRGASSAAQAAPLGDAGWDLAEARVLKRKVSPVVRVIGAVCLAAFWNGIVSVFVFQAMQTWRRGHPEWFLTIFLVPFVLVGLGLIGAVGYYFLALFNARPVLRISPGQVPLGSAFDVRWQLTGRYHQLRRFEVRFEGREEATYRQGTSTATDQETFARLLIVNTTSHADMAQGQARVQVPADTMHSFEAPNNKIVWALHVKGDIPLWPDINEEFEIQVLPARSFDAGGAPERPEAAT